MPARLSLLVVALRRPSADSGYFVTDDLDAFRGLDLDSYLALGRSWQDGDARVAHPGVLPEPAREV